MFGAKAGDHTFTAAWIDLDKAVAVLVAPAAEGAAAPDIATQRERALGAMQAGMLRNIGAGKAELVGRTVTLVDAAGESVGRLPVREVRGWARRRQARSRCARCLPAWASACSSSSCLPNRSTSRRWPSSIRCAAGRRLLASAR
ncbi:MAG: hypothetical protein R3E68_17110 [Burkholderiaceae bacterium]